MLINVKQQFIDKSKGVNCGWSCPVSQALQEVTGDKWYVGWHTASQWRRGRLIGFFTLPREAQNWIYTYAQKEVAVEPFSFEFGGLDD